MFKDLVKLNRSYRGYDETYVMTKEVLLDLVDCARLSPSSVNAQPFKYFLAFEKETVRKIQSLTKWARALPDMELPHKGMCPTGFIVICQDLNIGESLARCRYCCANNIVSRHRKRFRRLHDWEFWS